VGFGFSVAPQNQWREVGAGHTLRSSGLLHVEVNLARVSQSGLKTGGCCVGGKLKTDGSIRRATSDTATKPLPFSMY
jgi:hypothetical protein